MNSKKYMIKCCIILSAILVVVSTVGFPTPSAAHIVNNDVMSIQLARSEETVIIDSNLLTEQGQIVLLNGDFTEMTVPITVSGGDAVTAENEETEKMPAVITVQSSDEDRLQAELDKQEILLQKEGSVIQLTLRRIEPEEEETQLPTDSEVSGNDTTEDELESETESDGETVSGNDVVLTKTEEEKNEAEETDEEKVELFVEVSLVYREHTFSVTFMILESEDSDSEDENTIGNADSLANINELEAVNLLMTAAETEKTDTGKTDTGGKQVSDGDASGGEEKDEEAVDGEGTDEETAAEEITNGELIFWPSQYYPTEQILVINGDEQDCVLGGFPAMTRYTLDEQTYLLYQGGSIILPAGKTIQIDLSLTNFKEDLVLTSGKDTAHTIKYVELPQISQESFPLIIATETETIPFNCIWGELEPVIKAEHLVEDGEALIWKEIENITFEPDENGRLRVMSDQAKAGTYRITVSWIENEITLYQMEIPFFIQYRVVIEEVQEDDQ